MIGVTRKGPEGSPAFLFLHGGVINRHMWNQVIGELEADFDCIAIDLPGHGDLADQRFDVDSSVEGAIEVLDALSVDEAGVVGLSLGGYVAQAMAAAHPHRVSGLALSGATIRYTGWDGLSTKLYGFVFPLLARPATKAFAKRLASDLGEEVATPILDTGISLKAGGQAFRRLPGRDYAAEMTSYTGPIILANGERDTDNREAEQLFREHHPEAKSIVIEDAGHACALQQPKAYAAAVAQLTRTPPLP